MKLGILFISGRDPWPVARRCHTLKYLILGCDYLLQCVHLSIRFFSGILKIFLAIILFIQELDPFFFYLESSKILFHEVQIFYLDSSYPKLPPEFSSEFLGFFQNIFFVV
jgi:hypothetical protein